MLIEGAPFLFFFFMHLKSEHNYAKEYITSKQVNEDLHNLKKKKKSKLLMTRREHKGEKVGPGIIIYRFLNGSATKHIKHRILQVRMSLRSHLVQLSFNIGIL